VKIYHIVTDEGKHYPFGRFPNEGHAELVFQRIYNVGGLTTAGKRIVEVSEETHKQITDNIPDWPSF